MKQQLILGIESSCDPIPSLTEKGTTSSTFSARGSGASETAKLVLSIESSCDETAMSLIKFSESEGSFSFEVLSNVVASQIELHKKWGGVYPELASRAHLEAMMPVLLEALSPLREVQSSKSKIQINTENSKFKEMGQVDVIAVTQGPGLVGSLMMGVETAQILSSTFEKPIVPVNHLEGHIYSAFSAVNDKDLSSNNKTNKEDIKLTIPKENIFPILALVVSGGHTSLILMRDHLSYETIGRTIDDAAGEAFDKVARIMELGYPGGPAIEKIAKDGDENAYELPHSMIKSRDLRFSFSGLKTAVLYLTKNPSTQELLPYDKANLAASFQKTVVDILISKTIDAIHQFDPKTVILSGGVSANGYLRERFVSEISSLPTPHSLPPTILIPPKNLSTDNALGIAIAGTLKFNNNITIPWRDLDAKANFEIGTN